MGNIYAGCCVDFSYSMSFISDMHFFFTFKCHFNMMGNLFLKGLLYTDHVLHILVPVTFGQSFVCSR